MWVPGRERSPSGWPAKAIRCSQSSPIPTCAPRSGPHWALSRGARPRRIASRFCRQPTATAASYGLGLEHWYSVRIAIDQHELDPAPPSDPHQLAALLDVEERLSATDPYRQLGQL